MQDQARTSATSTWRSTALESGEIDAYPEYTGTALLSFFGKQAGAICPRTRRTPTRRPSRASPRDGLVAFPPTPFTSSNEVAVTKETAEKLGLQKISDLKGEAQDLTLAGSPECRERLDCLLGLEQVYGLKFEQLHAGPDPRAPRGTHLRESRRLDRVHHRSADPARVARSCSRTTRACSPPYNSTLVMRKEAADAAGPDLPKTLDADPGRLTDENMQELNARVDLDGQDPAAVAKAYLTENGLLPSS